PKNGGPAAARNAALARAQGRVLLFIDADCSIPDKDFIARACNTHLQHPEAVIGGGVQGYGNGYVAFADRFCHWATNIPAKTPGVVFTGHLVTANMIFSRDVFNQVGPLDERLRTGEDTVWCLKARSAGIELRLHGCLTLTHHDRETWKDFLACFYQVG